MQNQFEKFCKILQRIHPFENFVEFFEEEQGQNWHFPLAPSKRIKFFMDVVLISILSCSYIPTIISCLFLLPFSSVSLSFNGRQGVGSRCYQYLETLNSQISCFWGFHVIDLLSLHKFHVVYWTRQGHYQKRSNCSAWRWDSIVASIS